MTTQTPNAPGLPVVEARFWSRVDVRASDECGPWRGGNNSKGRGLLWFRGKTTTAPRVALRIATGENPPSEVFACHTCDNPACCNPAHLWWGSNRDNILDASAKGRLRNNRVTHCPKGHPYSGHNLQIVKGNQRRCRRCIMDRDNHREAEARKAARAALARTGEAK